MQDWIEDQAADAELRDRADDRAEDVAWIRSYAAEATADMDDDQALRFADQVREEHLQYTEEAMDGLDL